ncbi:unnamed protein product [Leptidea sinapis]|uniref:Uncharacterized protein n=1 Tax=Leptidea sinapis TaxID=189913 RepID=A0A5E4PQ84_9NEOP|nr:unnamed protein product [Leptidea sinapis]
MNKLLIITLAICLVSVHGFVKRDTEKPAEDFRVTLEKSLSEIGKKISDTVNMENLKENWEKAVNSINTMVGEFKLKPEEAKQ